MADQATVFVLKESLSSERQGKPLWYRFWTAIGPCCTDDPSERAEYPSRDAALKAPVWQHSLTFWEVEEVEAAEQDGEHS